METNNLLKRIADGVADSLIRERRHELHQVPGRGSIIVELAPEMNQRFRAPRQSDADRPNSIGASAAYVAAWHHIVAIFRETSGDGRVRWLWAPRAGTSGTLVAMG